MSKGYLIDVPIHIIPQFDSHCTDCDIADLIVDKDIVYANGEPYCVSYNLKCRHSKFCSVLSKNLQRGNNKNEE